MKRHVRLAATLACGLALAPALFAGCRQVLSFEERTFDPTLADAGTDLTCDAYCTLIQELCTGGRLQFSSVDACLGLCSSFPEGTLDDEGGNTLGCRIHRLETAKAMIEDSDCAAAGPGGDGVCGDNCVSLCASMATVCPSSFESTGDCEADCAQLADCGPYAVDTAVTPDDSTVQCRLYHVSAAAINFGGTPGELTPSQTTHCPHADGTTECIIEAGFQCP